MITTEYKGHDYKYDLDNIINIFLCEENIKNDYILKNFLFQPFSMIKMGMKLLVKKEILI
jgi:hypothetical protein